MSIAQHEEQAKAPAVTIGMPVYNGERFIREAIASVLNQTFTDFELIIADNCSSDATREICLEQVKHDSRLKYIRHEKNYGAFWNFGFVVRHARGRFFTWLAHDDILEPGFLEHTVNYLVRNTRTVIAAVDFAIIDEFGVELREDKLEDTRESLPWEIRRIPFFEFAYPNVHLCIYGLMQTKLCNSIVAGMKAPTMMTGSEYPLLARFAASGEIVALPVALRKYRSHNSSAFLTEVDKIGKMSQWRRLAFFYGNLFKLRMDLLKVLLGAPYTWKWKYRILRRHAILDVQFWRWKTSGTWIKPKTLTEEARDYGVTDARDGHLR